MKKYLLPTFTVLAVALGIVVGMALSQQANAQRIVFQNGQWHIEQSKIDRMLQLMEQAYVDSINVDSITDEVMTELVQKLDQVTILLEKLHQKVKQNLLQKRDCFVQYLEKRQEKLEITP